MSCSLFIGAVGVEQIFHPPGPPSEVGYFF